MNNLLIQPPVAFLIILVFSFLTSFIFSGLALKSKDNNSGKRKPYACGEDLQNPRIQPDFSQFFPFAFFFTIMHVLALVITTAPFFVVAYAGNVYLYVILAVCALLILFRNEGNTI